MANGILSAYGNSDINLFQKDFFQILKVFVHLDLLYAEGKTDTDRQLQKLEKLLEDLGKKYKGIRIKLKKGAEALKLRFFIRQKDVKELFAESGSKIQGLKSVGRLTPNQVEVSNSEQFAAFLDTIIDKIYLTFLDQDNTPSTFGLILDRNEKMIDITFNPQDIMNENSAIFKMLAFYALKEGVDKKIDIYNEAMTFGFQRVLNEIEKREWLEKFNPPFNLE